jgi:hypothetical protein
VVDKIRIQGVLIEQLGGVLRTVFQQLEIAGYSGSLLEVILAHPGEFVIWKLLDASDEVEFYLRWAKEDSESPFVNGTHVE